MATLWLISAYKCSTCNNSSASCSDPLWRYIIATRYTTISKSPNGNDISNTVLWVINLPSIWSSVNNQHPQSSHQAGHPTTTGWWFTAAASRRRHPNARAIISAKIRHDFNYLFALTSAEENELPMNYFASYFESGLLTVKGGHIICKYSWYWEMVPKMLLKPFSLPRSGSKVLANTVDEGICFPNTQNKLENYIQMWFQTISLELNEDSIRSRIGESCPCVIY